MSKQQTAQLAFGSTFGRRQTGADQQIAAFLKEAAARDKQIAATIDPPRKPAPIVKPAKVTPVKVPKSSTGIPGVPTPKTSTPAYHRQ